MPGDLFTQQFGINGGVERQEWRAEAGGEGSLRLFDPFFGAGQLGGITGQEIIHRLLGGQAGDGRHYTKSIGGQEKDVGRMPASALGDDVIQEADRVSGAGVFGQAVVVEIHPAGVLVDGDVFQNGAESGGWLSRSAVPIPGAA